MIRDQDGDVKHVCMPSLRVVRPAEAASFSSDSLTTKLDNSLRRELIVLGKPYTLVITPNGLALTPKGRRKGYELAWVRSGQRRCRAGGRAECFAGARAQTGTRASEAATSHNTKSKEPQAARPQAGTHKSSMTGRPALVAMLCAESGAPTSDGPLWVTSRERSPIGRRAVCEFTHPSHIQRWCGRLPLRLSAGAVDAKDHRSSRSEEYAGEPLVGVAAAR